MPKLTEEMSVIIKPLETNADKLEELQATVAVHRDLILQIQELEERLKELKKKRNDIEMKELPDLFMESHIEQIVIEGQGNVPPFEARLTPYYHANIPDDQKAEAFDWLEKNGFGDLIKTTFKIEFGLREHDPSNRFEEKIKKMGIDYSKDSKVPWNTLTSWLKERFEKQDTQLPPLSMFGATVGNIVRMKPKK